MLYNIKDKNKEWIPQVYMRYSWVTMQPGSRGQYRVKGKASKDLAKHWKGRILDFKMALGGKTIKEVLIQHVFIQKEINVGPLEGLPRHIPHCNVLYSNVANKIDDIHFFVLHRFVPIQSPGVGAYTMLNRILECGTW